MEDGDDLDVDKDSNMALIAQSLDFLPESQDGEIVWSCAQRLEVETMAPTVGPKRLLRPSTRGTNSP